MIAATQETAELRDTVAAILTKQVTGQLSQCLSLVAARPLEYCPHFPETAARWEAWWQGRADRPLLIAHTRRNPSVDPGKAFALLNQPDAYLEYRRRQTLDTDYPADGIPFLRVDLGPNALATFLKVPWQINDATVTTWHEHFLEPVDDCWNDPNHFRFDSEWPWVKNYLETVRRVARDAAGRYLVVLPDLAAGVDILVAMRSPAMLCMDLFEQRQAMRWAAELTVPAWAEVYRLIAETITSEGAGYMLWHNVWSNQPYDIPACDFNNMISPEDFAEVCLPPLQLQTAAIPRVCYHLDGPGCARHVDTLLAMDSIQAIQYTPGAGSPSALAKLPMLKKIQDAGKSLLVFPPAGEIAELARKLDPQRLAMWVQSPGSAAAAAQLARQITG
jgi:hypothetical protein